VTFWQRTRSVDVPVPSIVAPMPVISSLSTSTSRIRGTLVSTHS
jgi:hypothetical protein